MLPQPSYSRDDSDDMMFSRVSTRLWHREQEGEGPWMGEDDDWDHYSSQDEVGAAVMETTETGWTGLCGVWDGDARLPLGTPEAVLPDGREAKKTRRSARVELGGRLCSSSGPWERAFEGGEAPGAMGVESLSVTSLPLGPHVPESVGQGTGGERSTLGTCRVLRPCLMPKGRVCPEPSRRPRHIMEGMVWPRLTQICIGCCKQRRAFSCHWRGERECCRF